MTERKPPDLASIRHQLARLAGSRRTRQTEWSEETPTEWCPTQVRDPDGEGFFTQDGAWDFVASCLQGGELIREVTLEFPPGRKGYEMLISLEATAPKLYVKLQLGSGVVIGRSFHYSKIERRT